MKILITSIAFFILFMFAFLITACENFVDVKLPDSQLTGTKVFEDAATANAAMTDIYSKMRDTGILTGLSGGISSNLGMYADELVYYGSDIVPGLPYSNSLEPTSAIASTYWNESYHQIYCCNAVLEGTEKSSSLTDAEKKKLQGEALFVRGLIHLYLLNIYGDIPYITGTDYEINRQVGRMPSEKVYENITNDLSKAAGFLPLEYISAERVRPNRSAAFAVLARAFLYQGKWEEASNAASAVLNNPIYVWETNLNRIFLKSSTVTIWQFMPKRAGNNADEGASFIFNSGPPSTRALSNSLVNSFENGDLRRTSWIRTVSSTSGVWHHAYKYKQNANTGTSVEYSIVLRTAEQYLIRAEARAMQGDLIGAKDDLNKIRLNAGLSNTPAVTADEIVRAVQKERRSELFCEYGHRFFDLKRTGQLDAVLEAVKPGWESTDSLWPIPEKELLANPFLKPQNLGY
mgnify:CR=1 FL=1